MKRAITAIVLLVIVTVGSIVWLWSATHHFQPLQQLAEKAEAQFIDGDTEGALQTSELLASEYGRRTRFFDLFISHQALLETEKSVQSLPLILKYGDTQDFMSEIGRCILSLERLWKQELPRLDNIF